MNLRILISWGYKIINSQSCHEENTSPIHLAFQDYIIQIK